MTPPTLGRPVPEKVVQQHVVGLFRTAGCVVMSTSQYRASHVAVGLPDLLVFAPQPGIRASTWFEVKARDKAGRLKPLRPEQVEFQQLCATCGTPYHWGDLEVCQQVLVSWGLGEYRGTVFYLTAAAMRGRGR